MEEEVQKINVLALAMAENRSNEVFSNNCRLQIFDLYAKLYERNLELGTEEYDEGLECREYDPVIFFNKLKSSLENYTPEHSDNFHLYFIGFFVIENKAKRKKGLYDVKNAGIKYRNKEAEKFLYEVRNLADDHGIDVSRITDDNIEVIAGIYNKGRGVLKSIDDIRQALKEISRRKIDLIDKHLTDGEENFEPKYEDKTAVAQFEEVISKLDRVDYIAGQVACILDKAQTDQQRKVFRLFITLQILKELAEIEGGAEIIRVMGEKKLIDMVFVKYIETTGSDFEHKTIAKYLGTSEANLSKNFVGRFENARRESKREATNGR